MMYKKQICKKSQQSKYLSGKKCFHPTEKEWMYTNELITNQLCTLQYVVLKKCKHDKNNFVKVI